MKEEKKVSVRSINQAVLVPFAYDMLVLRVLAVTPDGRGVVSKTGGVDFEIGESGGCIDAEHRPGEWPTVGRFELAERKSWFGTHYEWQFIPNPYPEHFDLQEDNDAR